MVQQNNTTQKKKSLFLKMPPGQLVVYCTMHPQDSLAQTAMDTRMDRAFDVMADCAHFLPMDKKMQLLSCVERTVTQKDVTPRPSEFSDMFMHMKLKDRTSKDTALQTAIPDLISFSQVPMSEHKKQRLAHFMQRLGRDAFGRSASDFERGMDAYKQATSLFPHSL